MSSNIQVLTVSRQASREYKTAGCQYETRQLPTYLTIDIRQATQVSTIQLMVLMGLGVMSLPFYLVYFLKKWSWALHSNSQHHSITLVMMEVTIELSQAFKCSHRRCGKRTLLVVRGAYINNRGIAVRTVLPARLMPSPVASEANAAVADSHQLENQTINSPLHVTDTSSITASRNNSIGENKDEEQDDTTADSTIMAENSQPTGGPGGGAGGAGGAGGSARPDHVSPSDLQTYQHERASLKVALNKRASLRKKLVGYTKAIYTWLHFSDSFPLFG